MVICLSIININFVYSVCIVLTQKCTWKHRTNANREQNNGQARTRSKRKKRNNKTKQNLYREREPLTKQIGYLSTTFTCIIDLSGFNLFLVLGEFVFFFFVRYIFYCVCSVLDAHQLNAQERTNEQNVFFFLCFRYVFCHSFVCSVLFFCVCKKALRNCSVVTQKSAQASRCDIR